jgi:hypothetical protein
MKDTRSRTVSGVAGRSMTERRRRSALGLDVQVLLAYSSSEREVALNEPPLCGVADCRRIGQHGDIRIAARLSSSQESPLRKPWKSAQSSRLQARWWGNWWGQRIG